jgi:hypothetical protein
MQQVGLSPGLATALLVTGSCRKQKGTGEGGRKEARENTEQSDTVGKENARKERRAFKRDGICFKEDYTAATEWPMKEEDFFLDHSS